MSFISYEWPKLVDSNYADQIVEGLKDGLSPFDPSLGGRAVMFGVAGGEAPDVRVTILVESDDVLGYALYTDTELKEIFVLPEHRYNGYADKILGEARNWYRGKGIEAVDVTIAPTEEARRFWHARAIHGIGESQLLVDED